MGDFKTMLNGFALLAARLTGLQAPTVGAHMPPLSIDPVKKGRLEFRVIGCKPVNGTSDEQRDVYDAGTNTLVPTWIGLRTLTIQVKFTGFDNSPSQDALFYLERLGDRMIRPTSLDALRALDLGLITRGSFIDLSRVISAEDRQGSVGVKEFSFIAAVTEGPQTDQSFGWIETVDFFSDTLDGEDGNPLPHQISSTVTRP